MRNPSCPGSGPRARVAYLLDEIRLHGENAELKNEATDLARQFGLVTPYTAYLIMEDEHGRHVAGQNQVMKDFAGDRQAHASAGQAYQDFKSATGGFWWSRHRTLANNMKYAMQADTSLASGNINAAGAMSVPLRSSRLAPCHLINERHQL